MNENGKKPRRQFTAALKYQVLREARQTGTPVSQVCAKHQISPTLFYQWERAAERGAQAFLGKPVDPQTLIESTKQLIRASRA